LEQTLTPLAEGATFGNLLEKSVEIAGRYRACAARHAKLSELVTL